MKFKKGDIEGIIIKKLTKYTDERGYLIETFREDTLPDRLKPVMSYISFTKPGIARGPHEHRKQTDIFCFIGPGNFEIKLWDNRKESSTFGKFIEITGGLGNERPHSGGIQGLLGGGQGLFIMERVDHPEVFHSQSPH